MFLPVGGRRRDERVVALHQLGDNRRDVLGQLVLECGASATWTLPTPAIFAAACATPSAAVAGDQRDGLRRASPRR